jgi:transposase-like protein
MKEKKMSERPRCKKCQGTLRAETGVDLQSGVMIAEYVCYNCGRRWYGEEEPRPLTAA